MLPARLRAWHAADPSVVELSGEIDICTTPALRSLLLAQPARDTVVDVGGVSFFSAAGINLLMRLHGRLLANGRTLCLARPSRMIQRIITVVGLTEELPSRPSLAEAVDALTYGQPATSNARATAPAPRTGEELAATIRKPSTSSGGISAKDLRRYIGAVGTAVGVPTTAWWCVTAPPAQAYLAVCEGLPGRPDQHLALLWDEETGWNLAIGTSSGDGLRVLGYEASALRPAPAAVKGFLDATIAGHHPGLPAPVRPQPYATTSVDFNTCLRAAEQHN